MIKEQESRKRTLIGKIVSDKRAKTVAVLVSRHVKHDLYNKIVSKSVKYHAHDENEQYKEGDIVEIAETRPLSKTKNWIVVGLVDRASLV